MATIPTTAFLISSTGLLLAKDKSDSTKRMHWFITISYLKWESIICLCWNKLFSDPMFTSEFFVISSVWLISIESIPAWILIEFMSEMLMLLTKKINASLTLDRSLRFDWYFSFVMFRFLNENNDFFKNSS